MYTTVTVQSAIVLTVFIILIQKLKNIIILICIIHDPIVIKLDKFKNI